MYVSSLSKYTPEKLEQKMFKYKNKMDIKCVRRMRYLTSFTPKTNNVASLFKLNVLEIRSDYENAPIICDCCLLSPLFLSYTTEGVDFCQACYQKLSNANSIDDRVEIIENSRKIFPLI